MKIYYLLPTIFLLSKPSYSIEELPRENSSMDKEMNCQLIQKRLDLVKSQLAVVVEQYKIAFKKEILPKIRQAQDQGKSSSFSISPDNKFAQAIAKLSMAEATYEALGEVCAEMKQTKK